MLVKLAEVQALKKISSRVLLVCFYGKKILFMNLLFCLLRERQGEGGREEKRTVEGEKGRMRDK